MRRISVLLALLELVAWAHAAADTSSAERHTMVEAQIAARDVTDTQVLRAMRAVPRHEFVPSSLRARAYHDSPLPIGFGQTISQPYIVAVMTEAAALTPNSRVLEVGTGSGYQAAVAARIAGEVYSIELLDELSIRATQTLRRLGISNVKTRIGDGYQGWPEKAPFDAILVTAAAPLVPPALLEQLAPGGRLVIPVGPVGGIQELRVLTRRPDGSVGTERRFPVRFVPLVRP